MKNSKQYLLSYPIIFLASLNLSIVPVILLQRDSANAQGAQKPSTPSTTSSSSNLPSLPLSESPSLSSDTEKSKIATAETRGQKDESSINQVLPWIWALLHVAEIATLFILLSKLKDLKQKSADKASKLSEKITALESSLDEQKTSIRGLDTSLTTIKKSTSRMIDQKFLEQQARNNPNPPNVDYGKPQPSFAQAASLARFPNGDAPLTEYPFLEIYRQSPDTFKNQYSPNTVSEESENIQKRWAGEQQEIILAEDRQGNYWLIQENSTIYLIPSPKLKVNDMNMRTAGGLFDCENYTPGYRTMTVTKPAIVSAHVSMSNQRWKLEQKGVLEFT
jgi:hypothetical protein